MSGTSQREVQAECHQWLALLHSGNVTDADRARFESWLQADPRHRHAYELLQLVWNDISELLQLKTLKPRPSRRRAAPSVQRRALLWFAAAAVVAIAILAVNSRDETSPEFAQDYATRLGEVRTLQLPDGSSLTLGAYSHAAVKLSATERRVSLDRGEAYFDVAQDAARPFFVDARSAAVRVVGTRFDVRVGSNRVRIEVLSNGMLTKATPIDAGGADILPVRVTRTAQTIVIDTT